MSISNKRKYCNKCSRNRLLKFFSRDVQKKDGLRTYCKDCMNVEGKSYYEKNRQTVLKRIREYKENNAIYYKEYSANYRENNREELNRKNREYYQANRERVLRRTGEWAKKNRRKRALIDHRRRARALDQLGFVSDNIEDILWEEQNGKCYYCSGNLSQLGYHQEHKVPLARGGLHDDNNLCLSCPQCNFKKGYKTEEEFISQGGGYPRVTRSRNNS